MLFRSSMTIFELVQSYGKHVGIDMSPLTRDIKEICRIQDFMTDTINKHLVCLKISSKALDKQDACTKELT